MVHLLSYLDYLQSVIGPLLSDLCYLTLQLLAQLVHLLKEVSLLVDEHVIDVDSTIYSDCHSFSLAKNLKLVFLEFKLNSVRITRSLE